MSMVRLSDYNGDWAHDWAIYQSLSRALHKRADRVEASIRKEAARLAREAGIGDSGLGLMPHNALCAYHYGTPWKGVDYPKVRKVKWLMDSKMWRAREKIRQILDRHYDRIMELQRRAA